MSSRLGILAAVLAAVISYTVVTSVAGLRASAMPAWQVSADVSAVPPRPDISLQPLAASQLAVPASQAVDAAKAFFGLSDSQIVTAVPADISKMGDPIHSHQHAWVVVANDDIPAMGTPGMVFHKLCIVLDGSSGRNLWAYSTDASQGG